MLFIMVWVIFVEFELTFLIVGLSCLFKILSTAMYAKNNELVAAINKINQIKYSRCDSNCYPLCVAVAAHVASC